MTKKYTTEQVKEKILEVHGNKFDLSKVEYIDYKTKLHLICDLHGDFYIDYYHLISRKQSCAKCSKIKSANNFASNTEEFIKKAKEKHGDKCDYSLVEYKRSNIKVKITCIKHNHTFQITPNSHLIHNTGCIKCKRELLKMLNSNTLEEFILKAKEKHGNRYTYDEFEYVSSNIPSKIICSIHGVFYQRPNNHLNGNGCPKCGDIRTGLKLRKLFQIFKEKSEITHLNRYSYIEESYINMTTPIKIICPIHGEFLQEPRRHMNGAGCFKCKRIDEVSIRMTKPFSEFEIAANILYNNKYTYFESEYANSKNKTKIYCKEHDQFFYQIPQVHLNGSVACTKCKPISKSENKIAEILIKNNVKFERQISFNDCRYKNSMPFDFKVYNNNSFFMIEYQGKQHFEPIKFFGGEESFKIRQIKDQIKKDYCVKNNIRLLIIPYYETDLESVILRELDFL